MLSSDCNSGVETNCSIPSSPMLYENCVFRNSAEPIRFCCSFTRRRHSKARRTAHSRCSSGTGSSGCGYNSFKRPLIVLCTAVVSRPLSAPPNNTCPVQRLKRWNSLCRFGRHLFLESQQRLAQLRFHGLVVLWPYRVWFPGQEECIRWLWAGPTQQIGQACVALRRFGTALPHILPGALLATEQLGANQLPISVRVKVVL